MPANLADLIAYRTTARALREGLQRAPIPPAPPVTPHSFQQASPEPEPEDAAITAAKARIADAIRQLDAMAVRLDAVIARNGRWTRYVTGE